MGPMALSTKHIIFLLPGRVTPGRRLGRTYSAGEIRVNKCVNVSGDFLPLLV